MNFEFIYDRTNEHFVNIRGENLPYTYLDSYKDFLQETYGSKIVIAWNNLNNSFVALSLHKTKFLINAQLLSEPFTNDGPLPNNKQLEFYEELLISLRTNKIADRIITPQNFVVLGAAPKESFSCQFGSYQVDLTPSVDELYAKIHPKHRNKISKAERAGVEIKIGREQLSIFFSLYSETMKRSNMYCEPFSYFESFYDALSDKNCICLVAYHNEKPQGAILAPFTKFCCYYIYGASSSNITESGSMNYLHWETMLEMKRQDVKAYDFVGARLSDVSNTKLEGIQNFKERFGGELKKGFLFKADISKGKCSLFDALLNASNKVRGRKLFKDIIDQEIEKQNT